MSAEAASVLALLKDRIEGLNTSGGKLEISQVMRAISETAADTASAESSRPGYMCRWYNTDLAQHDWHMEPRELMNQVNKTLEGLSAGTKLISLTPAPPHVPQGFYLATFEVAS